jgi:hypothetical protein
LDHVLARVEALAPLRVRDVENKLHASGLTRRIFPLTTIVDIARRFSRKPRFSIVRGKVRRTTDSPVA